MLICVESHVCLLLKAQLRQTNKKLAIKIIKRSHNETTMSKYKKNIKQLKKITSSIECISINFANMFLLKKNTNKQASKNIFLDL